MSKEFKFVLVEPGLSSSPTSKPRRSTHSSRKTSGLGSVGVQRRRRPSKPVNSTSRFNALLDPELVIEKTIAKPPSTLEPDSNTSLLTEKLNQKSVNSTSRFNALLYPELVIEETIAKPPATREPDSNTSLLTEKLNQKMAEPRARAARHKGQMNFGPEIASLLHAFGDVSDPLPETVRVLDEIVTDFLIETCHDAAKTAAAAGRQKVKVEDFKFVIRGDPHMLGRVNELLALDRELKDARKQFDTEEGKVGLERGGRKKKAADKEAEMLDAEPEGEHEVGLSKS